jgi:hypothetical protein
MSGIPFFISSSAITTKAIIVKPVLFFLGFVSLMIYFPWAPFPCIFFSLYFSELILVYTASCAKKLVRTLMSHIQRPSNSSTTTKDSGFTFHIDSILQLYASNFLNNKGGYHKVVSQTEIEFVYKKLNIFRSTSASSGVQK